MKHTHLKTALLALTSLFLLGKATQATEENKEPKEVVQPKKIHAYDEQLQNVEKFEKVLKELENKPEEQEEKIKEQYKLLLSPGSSAERVQWIGAIANLNDGQAQLIKFFDRVCDFWLDSLLNDNFGVNFSSDLVTAYHYIKEFSQEAYEKRLANLKARLESMENDSQKQEKEIENQQYLMKQYVPPLDVYKKWVNIIESLSDGKEKLKKVALSAIKHGIPRNRMFREHFEYLMKQSGVNN